MAYKIFHYPCKKLVSLWWQGVNLQVLAFMPPKLLSKFLWWFPTAGVFYNFTLNKGEIIISEKSGLTLSDFIINSERTLEW